MSIWRLREMRNQAVAPIRAPTQMLPMLSHITLPVKCTAVVHAPAAGGPAQTIPSPAACCSIIFPSVFCSRASGGKARPNFCMQVPAGKHVVGHGVSEARAINTHGPDPGAMQ